MIDDPPPENTCQSGAGEVLNRMGPPLASSGPRAINHPDQTLDAVLVEVSDDDVRQFSPPSASTEGWRCVPERSSVHSGTGVHQDRVMDVDKPMERGSGGAGVLPA